MSNPTRQTTRDDPLWPINCVVLIVAGLVTGLVLATSPFPPLDTLDFGNRSILYTGWFRLATVGLLLAVAFLAVFFCQRWVARRLMFCALLGLLSHVALAAYLNTTFLVTFLDRNSPDLNWADDHEKVLLPDYQEINVKRSDIRQEFEKPLQTAAPQELPSPKVEQQEPTWKALVATPRSVELKPEAPEAVEPNRRDLPRRRAADERADVPLDRRDSQHRVELNDAPTQPELRPATASPPQRLETTLAQLDRRDTAALTRRPEPAPEAADAAPKPSPLDRVAASVELPDVVTPAAANDTPVARSQMGRLTLPLVTAPEQEFSGVTRPIVGAEQPTPLKPGLAAKAQRTTEAPPSGVDPAAVGAATFGATASGRVAVAGPTRARSSVATPSLSGGRLAPLGPRRAASRPSGDDILGMNAPIDDPIESSRLPREQAAAVRLDAHVADLGRRTTDLVATPDPARPDTPGASTSPADVLGPRRPPRSSVASPTLDATTANRLAPPARHTARLPSMLGADGPIPRADGVGMQETPAEAFEHRAADQRERMIQSHGGSIATERAVELGLDFLARHQFADGHWSVDRFPDESDRVYRNAHPGEMNADTAATGLALLAFFGATHTHQKGKHRESARRGLQWLVANQQPDGRLYSATTDRTRYARSYGHGIASIALCEAYGMTRDPALREPAEKAVQFILASQSERLGGWRYEPNGESDTSISGWQLMALKSAQMAGIDVPQERFARVEHWLDLARAGDGVRYRYNPYADDTPKQRPGREPSLAMTAEGLLMRMYLGSGRDRPDILAGGEYLKRNPPAFGTADGESRNAYYWYYATQAMFHLQGEYWSSWNGWMRPLLETSQTQEGPLAGSWDPRRPTTDRWAKSGGRHYVTTMSLLILEVYYRHLPLYDSLGGTVKDRNTN